MVASEGAGEGEGEGEGAGGGGGGGGVRSNLVLEGYAYPPLAMFSDSPPLLLSFLPVNVYLSSPTSFPHLPVASKASYEPAAFDHVLTIARTRREVSAPDSTSDEEEGMQLQPERKLSLPQILLPDRGKDPLLLLSSTPPLLLLCSTPPLLLSSSAPPLLLSSSSPLLILLGPPDVRCS
eukprot:747655-Hanusia_phi.AAC.1